MTFSNQQVKKAEILHQLHHSDSPLILPNIWDPLSALLLQNSGYKAAATSSSAIAQTNGWPDGEKLPFELLLNRLKLIVDKTSIPISADIESAYARSNEELKKNISLLMETGIAGINFEDSDKKTGKLIPFEKQQEKIRLIRKISEEKGIPLFINARIDTYVHGGDLNPDEKLSETIKRGEAYKKAGADCIFPILITDLNHIKTLIEQIVLPLNVMVFPGIPDLKTLKEIGVKRISLGGGFLKIALQPMKKLAEDLLHLEGSDRIFENEINSAYIEKLIDQSNLN